MSQSTKRDDLLSEKQLGELLRSAGARPAPPETMAQEVKLAVYEAWQDEVRRSRKVRNTRWLAFAASVTLAVSLGIFQLLPGTPDLVASLDEIVNQVEINTEDRWKVLTDESLLTRDSTIRTGPDAYASLTLDSGMNVRIDENTVLSITDVNLINLNQGRIYVDSYGNNPVGEFLVKTIYGTATDIGTQFAVTTSQDGWHVQVREGSVVVQDEEFKTTINDGIQISISDNGEFVTSDVTSNDPSWQWAEKVTPLFEIEGQSVERYLDWFSRETGKQVTFRSELARSAARSTILHGSIGGFQPGESLGIVMSTTDFKLIEENAGSVLIGK